MQYRETKVNGEKFNLGQTVITRGALAHCEDNSIDYLEFLMRHSVGDFGDVGKLTSVRLNENELNFGALVTANDLKLNAVAIKTGTGMIMSVYEIPRCGTIWIQTILAESETYTTILLPSEY